MKTVLGNPEVASLLYTAMKGKSHVDDEETGEQTPTRSQETTAAHGFIIEAEPLCQIILQTLTSPEIIESLKVVVRGETSKASEVKNSIGLLDYVEPLQDQVEDEWKFKIEHEFSAIN